MGLSLNNPYGLWALLGIPAVLLIHFLQRKARELPISTLFLLDQLNRESVTGRRIERLRPSIPLWLQLLAVLVLTWLLVQPRWLEKGSVQRITVVLDSSASMQAFKADLRKQLPQQLRRLAKATAATEYILLDSLLESERLYHGPSVDELAAALDAWTPIAGSHDPTAALRIARGLADRDGLVIFATDHALATLPFNARVFSVGTPRENAGFAGLALDEKDGQLLWKATLKNYGKAPILTQWWTESAGSKTAPASVSLAPGQAAALQGLFPPGGEPMLLRCQDDAFPLDDTLPVVKAQPKKLLLALPGASTDPADAAQQKLLRKLADTLPDTAISGDAAAAHALFSLYNPLQPALPGEKPAIVFVRDNREQIPGLGGTVVQETHPLLEGLHWHNLLCLDAMRIPARKGDETLLWMGDRPLIFLRGAGRNRQLVFNFDLMRSNAPKLPGLVILIHRFLDEIRRSLPLPLTDNFECAQKLALACETGPQAQPLTLRWTENGSEKSLTFPADQAALLTAPKVPCQFRVLQGEKELLRGAAHFGDTREADLSGAAGRNDLEQAEAALTDRFSREDAHWRLWVLVLLGLLCASWWFVRGENKRRAQSQPA